MHKGVKLEVKPKSETDSKSKSQIFQTLASIMIASCLLFLNFGHVN